MSNVRDLKNDPVEQRARRLAEYVYVVLGCASVPALQRAIAEALRKDDEREVKGGESESGPRQ